jgi:pimeloyl-ACP methyl ester carboxylesterase
MRIARLCLAVVVGFYAIVLLGFFAFQRGLLYFPSHTYVSLTDARANAALREFPVRTADGVDLKAWYAPATSKPYTIVFFHGNADNLASAAEIADPYIAAGYGFLVAEYRGYSGFAGSPTEAGLYADGRAYLYALRAQGVPTKSIILYGHSLGSGVATQLAEEFPVGGVMLLAPYLSIPKMAQVDYPFLPANLIALDRFENFKKMKNIHAPLLIVNDAMDQVIPPSQGKELFNLANEPRQFRSVPGHGHNDSFDGFVPISLDWLTWLRSRDEAVH